MMKDGYLIRRLYLDTLEEVSGDHKQLKIITGMRGVGKTTLMAQFAEEQSKKSNAPSIVDLDFDGIVGFDIKDKNDLRDTLLKNSDSEGNTVIILHEVHQVPEWEKVIADLVLTHDLGEFYITASDDSIMSIKNIEEMKDSIVEIRMSPMSLQEFMELNNFRSPKVALKSYLKIGGLPAVRADMPEETAYSILRGIFCEAVLKDVLTYDKSLPPVAALNMANHILVDSGAMMDSASVSGASGSSYRKSSHIVSAMVGCFLVFENEGRSFLSKLKRNKIVYYAADIGLRNCIKGYRPDPLNLAENALFIELKRLNYSIKIDGEGIERTITAVDDESSTVYTVFKNAPVSNTEGRIVITLSDEEEEGGYPLSKFLYDDVE